jgi:hypothetical protein
MLPNELKPEDFRAYRPTAKATAIEYLLVLQQLPLSFLPFLLKEIISLDWKFPAERDELVQQLVYLKSLSVIQRAGEMATFEQLHLSPDLQAFDWVNMPGQFLEKLSSQLWATSQMDAFRSASQQYMQDFRTAHPDEAPAVARLAVVLIGQGASASRYPLFRKLRRQGTYFSRIDGAQGVEHVVQLVESRAASQQVPYAHWFIDGGQIHLSNPLVALISYSDLASVRMSLTSKMRQAFESRMSPEALRTMLAGMTPEDLGMNSTQGDPVLNHFKVTLLTEGSGTQIYSTTFVQWTAREALRRAKPLTLVARFTPRQREAPMNELLNGTFKNTTDPGGSLVDADMGAWYTWISLQRLPGADQSSFLAWFEDHNEAVAVGPSFVKATEDNSPIGFPELLKRVAGSSATARA